MFIVVKFTTVIIIGAISVALGYVIGTLHNKKDD